MNRRWPIVISLALTGCPSGDKETAGSTTIVDVDSSPPPVTSETEATSNSDSDATATATQGTDGETSDPCELRMDEASCDEEPAGDSFEGCRWLETWSYTQMACGVSQFKCIPVTYVGDGCQVFDACAPDNFNSPLRTYVRETMPGEVEVLRSDTPCGEEPTPLQEWSVCTSIDNPACLCPCG